MMRTWTGIIALFFAVSAQAAVNLKTVSINVNQVKVSEVKATKFGSFSKVSVSGVETTKTVGAPELPVRSYLLQGTPEDITVTMNVKKENILSNTRPFPVQEQDCRCEVKQKAFSFNQEMYDAEQAPYKLTYLGAFRGTPITRLDVNLASYNAQSNNVTLRSEVEVATNTIDYSFEGGNYKDYVIVVPEVLAAGVEEFAAYKSSRGYNVVVEKVLAPANELSALKNLFKKHYDQGADFAIIVGDDKAVPMSMLSTSGSYQTPSDLPNFLMDGASDHIPDMFYGRIIASSVDQVRAQLAKSIDFEARTANASGLGKIIGVASNEGAAPSDKEYVTAVNEQFKKGLGVGELFLWQNDVKSNATTLNAQFNEGAFWMTYLGHGSGYSWPSFNMAYSMTEFAKLKNKNVTKPIIIDVACMNGRLTESYLGAASMKVVGEATGAAAYLGGTVNISWHPPALMARGIAIEHMAKKFNHLGEAILAGQLYLAANWTKEEDVIDNFEWYHLQGDPGMLVKF